jgi:hypothetical protein
MNIPLSKYLSRVFDDNVRILSREPFSGDENLVEVTMEIQSLGDLYLPTGQLIACDALGSVDGYGAFTKTVLPGRYPVTINVATFDFIERSTGREIRERKVAYSKVCFSQNLPTDWEIALRDDQVQENLVGDEFRGFGIDSGTACYMDACVGKYIKDFYTTDSESWNSELFGNLEELLNHNYQLNYSWANYRIPEVGRGNVVAFSSGWGDGGYPSYFGLDEFGSPLCLVTNFFIEDWDAVF